MSKYTVKDVVKELQHRGYDEQECQAIYDVFLEHYSTPEKNTYYFQDFMASVHFVSEDEYNYTIFNDFVEVWGIDDKLVPYLDEEAIVSDYSMDWHWENVVLKDRRIGIVMWRSF
jgi:hypothetical protein